MHAHTTHTRTHTLTVTENRYKLNSAKTYIPKHILTNIEKQNHNHKHTLTVTKTNKLYKDTHLFSLILSLPLFLTHIHILLTLRKK